MVRRYVGPSEAGASRRADADAHLGVATTGLLLLARISPCAPDHRSWARAAEWDGTPHSLAALSSLLVQRSSAYPERVDSLGSILVLLETSTPVGRWRSAVRGVILNAAFFVSYYERAFLGPVNAMSFALSRIFARPKRSSRDGALVLGIGLFPCSILR